MEKAVYPGKQFGNYRLLRLLGEGGFAQVYLGEHIHLKTQAAVKVLMTTLSKDEVSQFRDEACLTMEMDHPHIIRVLDFGLQGHTPFLVMAYARRGSLRTHHPEGTQLLLPTVVEYVNQMASALQYIHDRRLIHRDVKPENMLITQNGAITLSDFGIAVSVHSERSFRQQNIGGTAMYMAPELFEGKPRTESDQYALAIVVYEWLTGFPPFRGSLTQLAYQHALISPRPLREQIPVSPQVEQVILKGLAKDPLARFSTVSDFAQTLEEASYFYPSDKMLLPPIEGPIPVLVPKRQASLTVPQTGMYAPRQRFVPNAKKHWFLPFALIIGAFLLLSPLILWLVFVNDSLPGSGTSTSEEKAMVVSSFLSEVAQRDYIQAYSSFGAPVSFEITQMEFTSKAQADDRCYGPVTHYNEVPHSEKMQNGDFIVNYTVTRSGYSQSYILIFTLQQDTGSNDWLISSIGDHNDLGPKPPTC